MLASLIVPYIRPVCHTSRSNSSTLIFDHFAEAIRPIIFSTKWYSTQNWSLGGRKTDLFTFDNKIVSPIDCQLDIVKPNDKIDWPGPHKKRDGETFPCGRCYKMTKYLCYEKWLQPQILIKSIDCKLCLVRFLQLLKTRLSTVILS